jgi:eukaryotic-like serine/threonine-protein kinase
MPDLDPPLDQTSAGAAAREPHELNRTTDLSDPAAPPRETTPGALPAPHAERYRLLAEIARGGMGVVWSATDTTLGREVAVKVLQDRYAPGSGVARRFADEAHITAQLQHPAIPPVHDYGTLPDGRPFLAMKLIKGRTLDDLLQQRPEPSAERGGFVAVFEQVCQAVAYAHAHSVIHRDLKPANVMVGSFGEVQVMDWGLAKVLSGVADPAAPEADAGDTVDGTAIHGSDAGGFEVSFTQAGSVLGTLAYMAPEQAAGEVDKVGPRSDVFGLGATLAVILTGQPPYAGADSGAVRVMALRGDLAACLARLDGCGAELELVALCRRCLAFDPADRPRDAGAVAEEVAGLRAAAEERARSAEKERAAAEVKVAEQKKRRRWQRAVAVTVVLILALVGGGAWWFDHQASERDKERAVAAEQNRQEAAAALAQAERALSDGDFAAADQPLTVAESRLGAEGPPELVARLATAKRDRDLARGLAEIEDQGWIPGGIGASRPATIIMRFDELFGRYGLDVGRADPVASADAVRASRVSATLLLRLSEWFLVNPRHPHLHQLLDELDRDSDRAAVRAAVAAGDKERVQALVRALDGSKIPSWFAASVGFHPMVPPEDGVRLMAAAWRANPQTMRSLTGAAAACGGQRATKRCSAGPGWRSHFVQTARAPISC